MPRHTYRFEFEVCISERWRRGLMIGAMFFTTVSQLASESVTLTTYYPAPSGVYTKMITTNDTSLARDGGMVGIGTVSHKNILDVNGGMAVGSYAGANVAPPGGAIISGNVGIGTSSPASALSVAGGVQPGDDTSACTAAKDGTQRWHGGAAQVCSSGQWSAVMSAPSGTWGGMCALIPSGRMYTYTLKPIYPVIACDIYNKMANNSPQCAFDIGMDTRYCPTMCATGYSLLDTQGSGSLCIAN